MANKLDKENERQVPTEEAKKWCADNGNIPYFETSAILNTSVDEAFLTIVNKALDNQEKEQLDMPDTIGAMGGSGPI